MAQISLQLSPGANRRYNIGDSHPCASSSFTPGSTELLSAYVPTRTVEHKRHDKTGSPTRPGVSVTGCCIHPRPCWSAEDPARSEHTPFEAWSKHCLVRGKCPCSFFALQPPNPARNAQVDSVHNRHKIEKYCAIRLLVFLAAGIWEASSLSYVSMPGRIIGGLPLKSFPPVRKRKN
jgi:hypothetical protein